MCEEYPILHGILLLQRSQVKPIVAELQRGNFAQATFIALALPRRDKLRTVGLHAAYQSLVNHALSPSVLTTLNPSLLRLVWKWILRRSPAEFRYFFHRTSEHDALLFFYPLGFLKPQRQLTWLDLGAGVYNNYSELLTLHPGTIIYSVDYNFLNLYLSKHFYPQPGNVIYVNADMSAGPILAKAKADVITVLDALQCTPHQRLAVAAAVEMLQRNGILFFSALPEHLYFALTSSFYPLSRRTLTSFFRHGTYMLHDHARLATALHEQRSPTSAVITVRSELPFRYTCVYSPAGLPRWRQLSLPASLLRASSGVWDRAERTWSNSVY